MGEGVVLVPEEDEESLCLPPGFRFHPTDEEIITSYLWEKVLNSGFSARAMGEVDLNRCEPWDLPGRAKMGEKEWYFFCHRDRKYPTGVRTNRATESGYWKATGKDREIYYKGKGDQLVGMKKTLVFYMGRAPKGEKTNWVMHEYRLEGKSPSLPRAVKGEWVVCRVFHKNMNITDSKMNSGMMIRTSSFTTSFGDDFLNSPSLPPLLDSPIFLTTSSINSNYINGDQFKGSSTTPPPVHHLPDMAMEQQHQALQVHKISGLLSSYHPSRSSLELLRQAQLEASLLLSWPCKEEDCSHQSLQVISASQETVLSGDCRNVVEISSGAASMPASGGNCDDLEGLSSPMMPVIDMEDIYWKF